MKWSFAIKIKPNFNRLNSACPKVILISDFFKLIFDFFEFNQLLYILHQG